MTANNHHPSFSASAPLQTAQNAPVTALPPGATAKTSKQGDLFVTFKGRDEQLCGHSPLDVADDVMHVVHQEELRQRGVLAPLGLAVQVPLQDVQDALHGDRQLRLLRLRVALAGQLAERRLVAARRGEKEVDGEKIEGNRCVASFSLGPGTTLNEDRRGMNLDRTASVRT